MGRMTISNTSSHSETTSQSHSEGKSQSSSQSTTQKVLDEALRDRILAGLMGYMTDGEIDAYAENLLAPAKNAGLEAARQQYETAKLAGEQEIEDLAAELARAIDAQKRSYAQSAADVQTAAMARGMGRSSYALSTLANTGERYARQVRTLTQESDAKREQAREKMALAQRQSEQALGRIQADYAKALAAKVQELRENRQNAYNQHYMAAVNSSMGSSTTGQTQGTTSSDTTGRSETNGHSTTITESFRTGGGGSRRSTKPDAVSGAAPSVKYR